MRHPLIIAVLVFVVSVILPYPVRPQQTAPLTKEQVLQLVKFGMNSGELAGKIKQLGIDFTPDEDYLETLQKAGATAEVIGTLRAVKPQPLTAEQVGQLVAGGVPSQRAVSLVQERGINFVADDQYLATLRVAGAQEELVDALRVASKAVKADLEVTTSPRADVSLDGAPRGEADAQGMVVLIDKPGTHALKVILSGKKDYEKTVALTAGQTTRIDAALADAAGSIKVQAQAGAAVLVDSSNRGTADAQGQLIVQDLAPGPHELRVIAQGKKEFRQDITVLAGQENTIRATLVDEENSPAEVSNPDFDHLPTVWHSETTDHDFRVEVTKEFFRAEWINVPQESAKRGAYIRSQCRRIGSKWVGSSDINMLVTAPGSSAGVHNKLCQITIRFEVDSVSPEKITGQGESLRSFDIATCHVNETKWAPFTWVPKE